MSRARSPQVIGCERPDVAGRLEVSCWCGERTVWIPAADVGERTGTCGRAGCVPSPNIKPRPTHPADAADRMRTDPRRVARHTGEQLHSRSCTGCGREVFSAHDKATCCDCRDAQRKGTP